MSAGDRSLSFWVSKGHCGLLSLARRMARLETQHRCVSEFPPPACHSIAPFQESCAWATSEMDHRLPGLPKHAILEKSAFLKDSQPFVRLMASEDKKIEWGHSPLH